MMNNVLLKSTIGLLSLRSIKGVGEVTVAKLTERFDSFDEMLGGSDEAFKGVNRPIAAVLRTSETLTRAVEVAQEIVETARHHHVEVLSPFDEAYPSRLFDCESMPGIIYVKGDLGALDRAVTCVGMSEPSRFGEVVSQRLATFLAENDWSVVTGLTGGIETIAHKQALAIGTPTVAALPSGLGAIPYKKRELAEHTLEGGGCLISEQPFADEEDRGAAVRRYRLMSSLSVAIFMIQSSIESDGLHAVRYGIQQGRPIFVPETPERFLDDEKCKIAGQLANLSGPELARVIEFKESVLQRLVKDYPDRPVATAISGKDQYPEILDSLDNFILRHSSGPREAVQDLPSLAP